MLYRQICKCRREILIAFLMVILGLFVASCGAKEEAPSTTTTSTTSTTTTSTTTTTSSTSTTLPWTEETLTWTGTPEPNTSTCTIVTPTGYRMYYAGVGGIWTTSSSDGLSWEAPTFTGINDPGAMNPSVIKLKDGTYLMIYGVHTPMPITEKLFRATSSDGINFTKQPGPYEGGAVLTAEADEGNFVSVPDMIYINDSTIRLYFVANQVNTKINTAISTDNGQTWTREGQITLTGSYGGQTNDPDIVKLNDGTYRLYFTTPPPGTSIGNLRLRSAISTDGRNFTVESGDIKDPSGSITSIVDPDVVPVGSTGKYRCYYGTEPATTLHAIISP